MRNAIKMTALAIGFLLGGSVIQAAIAEDDPHHLQCYGAVAVFADGVGVATDHCYPTADEALHAEAIVYAADRSHTQKAFDRAIAIVYRSHYAVGIHCERQVGIITEETSLLGVNFTEEGASTRAFAARYSLDISTPKDGPWKRTECTPVVTFKPYDPASGRSLIEWRQRIYR
ncbi:hypothetical protein HZC00_04145 [Candidatus Kaiserbacteria bacterium]|nr:hypothetical protein [Candidatus Kaiserbacteria bacterium]